mgnify:CR=1 FL=1
MFRCCPCQIYSSINGIPANRSTRTCRTDESTRDGSRRAASRRVASICIPCEYFSFCHAISSINHREERQIAFRTHSVYTLRNIAMCLTYLSLSLSFSRLKIILEKIYDGSLWMRTLNKKITLQFHVYLRRLSVRVNNKLAILHGMST